MKYLKTSVFAVLGLFLVFLMQSATKPVPPDFKDDQKRYSRVRTAYAEKEKSLQQLFKTKDLQLGNCELFLRAFKKEKVLQVWAKKRGAEKFSHIKDYDFCALSGLIGPKRRQGDFQVPEGFYHIDRFNPASSFYLSLGINYPNQSDRILGSKSNLGGDIFIHGQCVTVGCIPITDPLIKELYVMAIEAKNAGQKNIPVHIFPMKMKGEDYEKLLEQNSKDKTLVKFWKNLEPGYRHFEKNKTLPAVKVAANGAYLFN